MKFESFHQLKFAADMINFWRRFPSEYFSELRKFYPDYIYYFGTTYRCEQTFASKRLIKKKRKIKILKNSLPFLNNEFNTQH